MAKKPSAPAVMLNLTIGHWVARLIYVAAKLKLADLLKNGPRTTAQLATATGVQAPALYRILRTLASVGVFAETKGGRFKLTPLAATLRSDVPGSMRAWAIMANEKYTWDSWMDLLHGVKTGEIPFIKAHGVHPFEYLEKHPDDLAVFGESMTSLSATENPAIAAAYKFSAIQTLVDVGGGHGSLLATILKANPKLKGVLFDQPSVIARARKDRHVTAKGIAERCTVESGSFFETVPAGGDAYIMKYILHDWNDEQCVKILANCRAAMNEKGRVLVVDNVIPTGNDPSWGKLVDIQMLVIGGRERTKKEFAAIFAKAGLKMTRVVATKCPLSIVEGVRA
ncbi:MAG TPA: methyltransferase [Candidatus Udaeobacter sp.]|nr:methyltransferase [Candidatus Udaeobacter sp.]